MHIPNFLVIGAAKSATTALYDYLGEHPDIYMSPLKETNFLALEGHPLDFRGPGDAAYIGKWAITTLERYCEEFAGVTTERAVGEASPLYMYDPDGTVIDRIRRYVPHARFIAIVRHPADRAYSAYLHTIRDKRECHHDFACALAVEEERIAAHWEHIWHYRNMGYYGRQLQRYYDAFGADRIQVHLYEDFKLRPVEIMQDCYRFLGVDDSFVPLMPIWPNNALELGENKPPFQPEVRRQLIELYEEDFQLLERLIGRDLSHWRT